MPLLSLNCRKETKADKTMKPPKPGISRQCSRMSVMSNIAATSFVSNKTESAPAHVVTNPWSAAQHQQVSNTVSGKHSTSFLDQIENFAFNISPFITYQI